MDNLLFGVCVDATHCLLQSLLHPHMHRINKKGSQKDAEQKKNGNYFFYDDGVDEVEEEDIDDFDL
jgi:hypothetical protein